MPHIKIPHQISNCPRAWQGILRGVVDVDNFVVFKLVFLNSSCFAGGFYLSPTASPVSGKLDCCIFNITSFTDLLKVSIDIKRKKHLETNKIDILKQKSFTIYSDNPLECQIDGEIIKLEGNVNVSLRPSALKVITYNPS